jgi:outer membrane protein OmpA-like peptidoglycan-associated protein
VPWDCPSCNTHVPSDATTECPQCGLAKGQWTLAGGRTRTFRVTGAKKFELLFGPGREPCPANAATPAAKDLRAAERVVSVPKEQARAWAKAGKLPPQEQVLIVRCWSGDPQVEVCVAVEYAAQEAKELPPFTWKAPHKEGDKPCHDARYLFVHGEGDAAGITFTGHQVVDLTEATETGHAPRVGVRALGGKKRTLLPVDRLEKGWAERLQCHELDFPHDSHLLLPDGLSVLHLVLVHAKANPTLRLVIAGHTDATGSDQRNDDLARDRCENILHMLEGDRDAWAKSALGSYTHLLSAAPQKAAADVKYVEDWVGHPSGAGATGFAGFARRYKDEFPKGEDLRGKGWKDVASWRAVYDFYEQALLDFVDSPTLTPQTLRLADQKPPAEREAFLEAARVKHEELRRARLAQLRAGLHFVDDARKVVGCGERYLKVKTEGKSQTNRRDEFLFFFPGRWPWTKAAPPADEEAARRALYGEGGAGWDWQTNDGPWTFDALDCPAPPEIEVPPGDVLFVIDCSGSMDAVDPPEKERKTNRTRMELCRTSLTATLRAVPTDRSFSLTSFAYGVSPWPAGLRSASRMAKASGYRWIEALHALQEGKANTNTAGALDQALGLAGIESIVLLSDGAPTVGELNEATLLARVREKNPPGAARRRIDTYGFLVGQDIVDDANRAKVEAAFEAELVKTGPLSTVEQKGALWKRLTAALATQKVKTRRGTALTSLEVQNVTLGWFLRKLAEENGGTFKDLNAPPT